MEPVPIEDLLLLIPDTNEYHVGSLVRDPRFEENIPPRYFLRTRAIRNKKRRMFQFGPAQILLGSGEIVPVKIIGKSRATVLLKPGQPFDKSILDERIDIDASMITPEQIKEAKLIVQRFGADNKPI